MISRTLVFERQPMTIGFQYYYNLIHPDNSNSTSVRFRAQLPAKPSGK
jgi:hypothetical protein